MRVALENLRAAIEKLFGERVATLNTGDGYEQVPLVEDFLYKSHGGARPHQFLKQPEPQQKEKWRAAFQHVLDGFSKDQHAHHILGAHLTFRSAQVPTCPIGFGQLVEWAPDCILTFVDDAYCVRERIHLGGYKTFTLSELILWRAEEVLIADLLARMIHRDQPPPNYVVAVQHPAAMVARLLRTDTVPVYLSHPIRDVRDVPASRDAIDELRRKFRNQPRVAVFEPLTIDEVPPLLRPKSESGVLCYDFKDPSIRWPALDEGTTLANRDDLNSHLPLRIPYSELEGARGAIEAQVVVRDYRLVDQAQVLVIYRPTMGQRGKGTIGAGVTAEWHRAENQGKRVIWYLKNGEDPLPSPPFAPDQGDPDVIYEPTDDRLVGVLGSLRPDPKARHFLR